MPQDNLGEGSKTMKPEVDLAAVSIQSRMLPFWREIPRAWFIQFEAVVDPLKTSDDQKYRYVLQQLQATDLQHITDILYNPPATDKYGAVKNRLLTVYDKYDVKNFQKLISGLELGDQKPTQLLRKMRELGTGMITDEGLKIEWLNHLPTRMRVVLSINTESSLDTLAAMADKMAEYSEPSTMTVAAVSTTSQEPVMSTQLEVLSKQMEKLCLEVAELRGRSAHRYRRPFRSRSRSQSRSRQGNKTSIRPGDPSWECRFHHRYGDKAKRCESPCCRRKKSFRVASWLQSYSLFNFLGTLRQVDWGGWRRDTHNLFTKLIRTKDPRESEQSQEVSLPGRQRLSRCLTTMDLTSLGVGSCVGTGMYLVAGMVARKFAGPGVVISFIIAALASIFSGACYAEFGVRVPHTTGSAYMYSYVTVGEFIAFIIGWNMILEYLIGSSACARALSACFDSLCDGAISRKLADKIGTMYGKPPDLMACGITLMMMMVLVAGVRKSLFFNNLLNAINLSIWVFIMTAGLFYIDVSNWTEHNGFLPFGWSGVFSGAATCFYAFIGFDIIATTGEEANNPKRSIPLAIVNSLGIILLAYVSTSMILTLMVPYDQVDTDSALVQMFAHVNAPTCKYIVAIGALAGLTVSMFGSMFPMPRVVYAMALDGLIFKKLAAISESTGTPAFATICGGIAASVVALMIQLEVLVEMMSIGTLLAYTLVSTCVLVLRYQPHSTNLIELLPQSLRTPVDPEGTASANRETTFTAHASTHIMPPSQRVMVRRVTRSSPDSDDTLPGDESEEYRDDTFLVNSNNENNYYVGGGSSGNNSTCSRFLAAVSRQLHAMSYLCPGLFPWVDCGPATEMSGMFVIKSVGIMYLLIILFDLFAAYGNPGTSTFTNVTMILLILAIFTILLMISRRPQNRVALIYTTPGLPFVPTIAIIVNIYLILNLSILTLVRFTIWMILGMFMYFKYGIKNSTLETNPPVPTPETPPAPNPLDRTTIPPPSPYQARPTGDRNIFEGDGNEGLYGNMEYDNALLTWHDSNLQPVGSSSGLSTPSSETNRMQPQAQPPHTYNPSTYRQVETVYDPRTNRTSTVTSSISRPPWAYPDAAYGNWD